MYTYMYIYVYIYPCLIELGGFTGMIHAERLALGLGGRRPSSVRL